MASYAQPGGFTQGSIAYADADGFLTENNAQLYWDAAQHFLGVGVSAPVCRTHIRIAECADYEGVKPDVVLLLEDALNVRLQLQTATTGTAYIEFCSDENNPPAGRIAYDFPNVQLEFGVGGNEILRLKVGPTFDYAGTLTLDGIVAITGASLNLRNNAELRFYDNGNYVGFEAPGLIANQIWVLPDEDGNAGDVIITSGAGVLSFSPAGAGDVTAAAVMADHAIVRGDGGAKGVQDTGILVDDNDNMTLPDGASLTLQESIVFAGATTENQVKFPDNLPDAFSFMEGANPYLTFVTTNGSEAVSLAKTLILSTVINAGVDTDKFLVLDAGNRIDFRTGAELLADIGGIAATTFIALTDTPGNYVGDAGKFCKVKATEDGLEFGAGGDGGDGGPVLIFDSEFNDLALGNINGKGVYTLWGAWVNGSGAGCTAEIVADPGNGRMLRLDDQSAVNECHVSLTMTPALSAEVLVGVVEWKMKINQFAAGSRGYFNIQDKDIGGTEQGGYFRGDSNDIWYRSSGGITAHLVNAVVDTWYIVRCFFDRLGNYTVWWVDGAFEQNRIIMNTGDKFDKLVFSTRDIHSGNVFDIKYVKVWSLNYVT